MKICFTHRPINTSFGGGNQFVLNMIKYIKNKDQSIQIVFDLNHRDIDIIFIIDPRYLSCNKVNINMVLKYKQFFPNVKIIHRVNECDIKREKSINIEPLLIKTMQIADKVIFVSKWLQNYFIQKYKLTLNSTAILNGCNTDHFHFSDKSKFNNEKIKLVTHHFSNNYLKGFHIYNALDKLLEIRKDIEFTYIGNYNLNYKPKNIKLLQPINGEELGKLINKHDIYLTATQNEPGAMHYLEGLSCGLPVLYCKNGGGAKEICCMAGEEYYNIETLLIKIEVIKNNYEDYVNRINYEYLRSDRCCEEYYEIIKNL